MKNAHEKAISDLDDACEFTNFSNPNLAEELPETVTFCAQKKKKKSERLLKKFGNLSWRWVYRFIFLSNLLGN